MLFNKPTKLKTAAAFVCLTLWFAIGMPANMQAQMPDDPALQEKYQQAETLFDEARELANQGTAESMQAAIPKLEAARLLYHETNSRQYEAYCLGWLGFISNRLGEKQKALDYYNQSLPLARAVGDKTQETVTLNNIGAVYNSLGEKQKALEYYAQSLLLRRALGDKSGEATTLTNIGVVYDDLGEKQKALAYHNQALPLRRAVGDNSGEAATLNSIGKVYSDLGEKQKSLDHYEKALPLYRQVGDISGEVGILSSIGALYLALGESQKALEFYNQALPLYKKVGDKLGEGKTLNSIGSAYFYLGENQKSLEFHSQALPFYKRSGNKVGEVIVLNNIGLVYYSLGEMQKALEYYNQALLLNKQTGDKSGEAVTLDNIGLVFWELGENQKALEFYNQALPLRRQVEDKLGEADTLNNIGAVYRNLGEDQKALEFYNQALSLYKRVGDKLGEANTLNNIGVTYRNLGDNQKALEFYGQALPLRRQIGNKSGEADTLNNIGAVYDDLGERQKALEYFLASLSLKKAVGDKSGQANTLDWLMSYWDSLKNPRFAVFYGKQSVNLFQELRSNIQGLDKETQKTYLKSIEYVYRRLADILIVQGRIAEAEEVLAMLKEEEYLSYLRRDDKVAADLKGRISLSADEKKAFEDYEKFSDEITRTAEEFGALEKKKNSLALGESLTAEDQKEYDGLKAKYDAAVTVFNKYLDDLKTKFSENDKRVASVESDTQGLLKKLNQPRTVIISTIVGEDRLNLILTTSDIQKAHTVDIKAADLNKLVTAFRAAVKDSKVDPRPLGKKLYDVLFPAALQKDLANIKADTLVWSLDGTLRYVPMAALYDGEKYLVERYTNAVLTLASRDKLTAEISDRTKWLAFGVGVSKEFEGFPALAAVPSELCSVVDDPKKKEFCDKLGANGAVKGLMLSDDEFTLKSFQNNLGKTAIVHIASHFALNAGNETDSYLLLGGGDERRFSLDGLKKTRLDNVELLTLSACNTAMTSGANSSGVEIEGFGALAQKQGAKTVLATLWAVADDSTGSLMTRFYKILETEPQTGKAEALRKAQIALLTGKTANDGKSSEERSKLAGTAGTTEKQPPFTPDENAPFAHPYFWSPFVLIGNWR